MNSLAARGARFLEVDLRTVSGYVDMYGAAEGLVASLPC